MAVWIYKIPSNLWICLLNMLDFMQFWHQNVINYGSMFSGKAGNNTFSSVNCNELFERASLDISWEPVAPSGNIHAPKPQFGHSQFSDFNFDNIFEGNTFGVSKRKVVTFDCDIFISNFNVFVLEQQFLFVHLVWWIFKLIKLRI